MSENMKRDMLYTLQEAVLARLQAMGDSQFDAAKLCGGTALARCWLAHRLSYDLDFFLPHGFMAADMAKAMKTADITYETRDIVDDPRKANQLHGHVVLNGRRLRVSFVEDAYFETFPALERPIGRMTVRTENIAGLYHRKLRTVAGSGSQGDSFEGGRQKARDLFDLHVLSVRFKPIRDFIDSLPYAFPCEAFDNGLANMPWFDLMDELEEINCAPEWNQAKDVMYLQNALYEQIGATRLPGEMLTQAAKDPAPAAPESPKGVRRRSSARAQRGLSK